MACRERRGRSVGVSRFDAWVRSVGEDPDPRFTLANERTFLAWMTTSLGLLGIGLAMGAISARQPVPIRTVALLWIVLGSVLAVRALLRWFTLERALRRNEAFPLSISIPLVAVAIALLSLLSAAVLVVVT